MWGSNITYYGVKGRSLPLVQPQEHVCYASDSMLPLHMPWTHLQVVIRNCRILTKRLVSVWTCSSQIPSF